MIRMKTNDQEVDTLNYAFKRAGPDPPNQTSGQNTGRYALKYLVMDEIRQTSDLENVLTV